MSLAEHWRIEASQLRAALGPWGFGMAAMRPEGFAVFLDQRSHEAQCYAAELEALAEMADGRGEFGS